MHDDDFGAILAAAALAHQHAWALFSMPEAVAKGELRSLRDPDDDAWEGSRILSFDLDRLFDIVIEMTIELLSGLIPLHILHNAAKPIFSSNG